jgi:hypothetical protein
MPPLMEANEMPKKRDVLIMGSSSGFDIVDDEEG